MSIWPWRSPGETVGRRTFLRGAAAAVAAAALPATLPRAEAAAPAGAGAAHGHQKLAAPPRGAIYISTRAWNAYQMWRDYDPKIAQRDLQFARSLRLDALRVWLSYEFYLHDRAALKQHFDDLLRRSAAAGIRIMPVLFESDGVEPTRQNLLDEHPLSASDVLSPSTNIVQDRRLWRGPRGFIEWFMHHYRDDRRLLAVEISNEPWAPGRMIFAKDMLRHAAARRGKILLTIGGASLKQSLFFLDDGIDILQTHQDFPATLQAFRHTMHSQILIPQRVLDKPVWLTEWQRLRPHGSGWGNRPLQGTQWAPDYASMAPAVRAAGIGNFFWSLMVKPAWLLVQRKKGTLNGVFHEDGAVWSLADARAISGNKSFHAVERQQWPRWAKAIPEHLGMAAGR